MGMTNSTFGPEDTRHHGVTPHHAVVAAGAGSSAEAIAGVGAITLSILGLAGVLPFIFAAIAAITLGAAFLLEGLALARSFGEEVHGRMIPADRQTEASIGGGLSAQALGGAAGVTLGILALVGVSSWILLNVAVIVFGATMLIGGTVRPELVDERVLTGGAAQTTTYASAQAVRTSGGAMLLAGVATVVLGILALVNRDAPGMMHTLILVSFLVTGCASLLGGSGMLSRVADAMH